MWEPSEKEAEACLEFGQACEYGICSECVIGNGGNITCRNTSEEQENEQEGNM